MWSNISAPLRSLKGSPLSRIDIKRENDTDNIPQRSQQSVGSQNDNQAGRADGSPLMRYKHAVCSAPSGYIYIHGGRFGNLPLDDDVWRFDAHQNSWLQLETRGNKPPSLQEHTLIEYNEQLYLFGGQVSASQLENSFWRLDLVSSEWHSMSLRSNKYGAYLGPTNRRGHSAVIYGDSMYIYGGFEDFRGSSGQLWEFNLLSQRWELRNLSSTSACHPEPRHSHSAIVFEDSMFVYGGLSNLKPLNDLWRWSWREKRWFKEKTRGTSPGQLHGHTAIQAFGSMFVFGGERNGRASRSLWRLNLSNMSWRKIKPKGPRPSPTTWHAAIANPLSILDEANYMIEGDQELLESNCMLSFTSPSAATNHQREPSEGPQSRLELINSELQQQPVAGAGILRTDKSLSHSKSSSGPLQSAGKPSMSVRVSSKQKRKSRLSFLRRYRKPERPRSSYELKQMYSSVSAGDFAAIARHRHSMLAVTPNETSANGNRLQLEQCENGAETNVGILDSLDSDIKEMFEQALTSNEAAAASGRGDQSNDGPDFEDELMSVEIEQQQQRQSMATSSDCSQYRTAICDRDPTLQELTLRSQRTSHAYTTPPSEPADGSSMISRIGQSGGRTLLAAGEQSAGASDRRNNRPRSEIVQSLIDRADARIKHLYTPYFNGQQQHPSARLMSSQRNRLSLDRPAKRHTIHQTMTYYNLYFSEDKSSSSPPSDSDGSKQPQPANERSHLVRDDLSSRTIKAYAPTGGGATLVGVHGGSYLSQASERQVSQLSLDTTTNSDSKTLCGEIGSLATSNSGTNDGRHNSGSGPPLDGIAGAAFGPLPVGRASLLERDALEAADRQQLIGDATASSLQMGATNESISSRCGDNTSLSFSAIAEFEEDDMLQYSSPSDMSYANNGIPHNHYHNQAPADELRTNESKRQSVLMNERDDDDDRDRDMDSEEGDEPLQPIAADTKALKSASSGYDSISGGAEQRQKLASTGMSGAPSTSCSNQANSVASAQEDGTESSLGELLTEETSPEQQASFKRRMRARNALYLNGPEAAINNTETTTTTTSSTTADSLTSKSLPASPPEVQRNGNSAAQTGRKLAPVSSAKKRFFQQTANKSSRYWQLCMFVIGGKQANDAHGVNAPITIWRLYI